MPNLTLDIFSRLNESVSPEKLNPDELATFVNAILNEKTGKPVKRNGWSRFNSNQADSSGNILSMHDVISSDGTNYLLAGINGKLRKSTSGTGAWSDVTSKGTPPYKLAPFLDGFILTEGTEKPFLVTGASLGSVMDLEIVAPDISGIYTGTINSATGSLEEGANYKWIFCYVTDLGELSPPSTPITHYIDAGHLSTDASYKRIGFKDIPASADTRVTGIRIFRTLKDGETYYYHSQLSNETQNWFDNIPDAELGSETFLFLNCPQTSQYITVHKDRVWQAYITRTVKNWFMPAFSQADSGNFSASTGGVTNIFTPGIPFSVEIIAGTGTLPAGDVTYRIIYVDADGLMSDPIDSNTLTISATNNILFNNLPSLNVLGTIVRADVYRDIDGAGFYKIFDYIPTTANVIDSYLAIEDQGFTDGTAYSTNQTTETNRTGIAFSEIGQGASYPLENLRNIFPDDGDEIKGIYDDVDGLLIFKEKSICKIYTSGSPNGWRLIKLVENIGVSQPKSIAKYGNEYYFVYLNKIYRFNSGGGYENIGEPIKNTLNLGYTFTSATITNRWYLLGGYYAGNYLFFVYDYFLKTWYIFTTSSYTYATIIKTYGTNAGKILTTYQGYVSSYGTGSVDSDTGSSADISVNIRSKTFTLPDAISLIRLRKLKFNYKKLDDKNVVITVVDPDSGTTNTFTDSTNAVNSSDWKTFEDGTKDTDSLKVTPKLYIQVTGAGLVEWGTLRQEYRLINRGKASV